MEIILIIYLVVSIALIGIILLQQGKGAEMGASFGAGGASTVFGAAGSGNALTKATTILTILFFAIALAISYMNSSPEVLTDSILDESNTAEAASKIEDKSLDAQIPQVKSGIEAEVAPTTEQNIDSTSTEKPVIDQLKAKTNKTQSQVEKKAEDIKATVEKKQAATKDKTKQDNTPQ